MEGARAGVEEDGQHHVLAPRVLDTLLRRGCADLFCSPQSLMPAIPSPPQVAARSSQAVGFGDQTPKLGDSLDLSSPWALCCCNCASCSSSFWDLTVWLIAVPTPWCDPRTLTWWVKFLFVSPVPLNKQVKTERKREHPASLEKFIFVFILITCAYHLGLWHLRVMWLSLSNKKMKLVLELFTNRRSGEGAFCTPKSLKGETNPNKGAITEKLPKCSLSLC